MTSSAFETGTAPTPPGAGIGEKPRLGKIIGSTHWLDADGRRQERFQVITLREGKIADMQGCSSRREAERFAGRHSLSRT